MRSWRPALAIVAAVVLAAPQTAAGETFKPTREDDPPPGDCKPNNCSLREAIGAANDRDGADRVVLGKGSYRIELPDIVGDNSDGDFDVNDEMSLVGKGSSKTTVDGQGIFRVFTLTGFSPRTIKGMTIRGGFAPSSRGGALFIGPSDATFEDVIIKDNEAGAGGAISSVSTDLRFIESKVTDNTASGRGGGILFTAGVQPPSAVIVRSTISGNEAQIGGGIHADGTNDSIFEDEPWLTISNSTIKGNTATGPGGGIASSATKLDIKRTTISGNTGLEGGGMDLRPGPEPPVTKLRYSTVSGNSATNKAGGIIVDGNPFVGSDYPDEPELQVENSTIAGNSANNDAGGVLGDNEAKIDIEHSSIGFNTANADNVGTASGGGVFQHSNASFSVDDSVLANNAVGQGGSAPDCFATEVFSGAGNVISSTSGCSVSFTTPFNKYSASLIAKDIDANGGPTKTMKVPNGSEAIGFSNECPPRDQRGEKRPDDCDSGAYENKPAG